MKQQVILCYPLFYTRESRKRKGQQMNVTRTVAHCDHAFWFESVTWAGRPPLTIKVSASFFSPYKYMEEEMIERFHGIDRHKHHFTVSVLDREGKEIEFLRKRVDLDGYIEKLGAEDAVVLEASAGTFF